MTLNDEINSSPKEQPRSIADRRQYTYTHHIPERRSGRERRHDDHGTASDNPAAADRKQDSE